MEKPFNQKKLWDEAHVKNLNSDKTPSEFAKEIVELIPSDYEILELGCGQGNDAAFFVEKGLTVVATDFSGKIVERDKKTHSKLSNLTFLELDISNPLPFKYGEIDCIYANLSLHYFDDKTTKGIFKEIYRVLKNNGFFCFTCKSTKSTLYGQGEKIETDMFAIEGHIRHFFDEEYVRKLLDEDYKFRVWEENDPKSSYLIKVIAQKRPI